MNETERQALAAIQERKRAYQIAFNAKNGILLDDMARFCRADRSCFDPDPRIHALLEGRREVYLRIREHLDLTVEELFEIKTQWRLGQETNDDA